MKKNLLITVIAAVLILFIASSCDLGEKVTSISQVPSWLANKEFNTLGATADATREAAEVGQEYFYGVSATSNSITLLYKVKGNGATVESDSTVRYRQEDVPKMINSSYKSNPAIIDPQDTSGNTVLIWASEQDNSSGPWLRIRRSFEPLEGWVIYFYFDQNGIGGFRILK